MPTINHSFFDQVQDRRNTGAVKYDFSRFETVHPDLVPMWIADMDFRVAPEIVEALAAEVQRGIFGYNDKDDDFDQAVISWYRKRLNWTIDPEWLVKSPSVIFSITASIRALTEPGDTVLICQPVYFPFVQMIERTERRLAVSEMQLVNGKYEMDFADFERKIVECKVKLFILCSPHNPVGRVWTKEELAEMGRICLKHNVYIISDEIHADIVFDGYQHTPFLSVSDEFAAYTITCISPTKTFNLAGLQVANAVIPNADIREKVRKTGLAAGYGDLNNMAMVAAKTAYRFGEPWFDMFLTYMAENVTILREALAAMDGKISLINPEGTYLMWLDCRNMGFSDDQLDRFFLEKAGIWLHRGTTFGTGGSGFVRMNLACPQAVLHKVLERLRQQIAALEG